MVFIFGAWRREGGEACYLEGGTAQVGTRGQLKKKKNTALQKKILEYLVVFPLSHDVYYFQKITLMFSNMTSTYVSFHLSYTCVNSQKISWCNNYMRGTHTKATHMFWVTKVIQ